MWLALFLIAGMADWTPARWISSDPQTLPLIEQTPINCVLLEESQWSAEFAAAAREKGIATLGVIRPGDTAADAAARAADEKLTGIVLEGPFEPADTKRLRVLLDRAGLSVVELPPRAWLDLNSREPVLGSYQGLWPGIHTLDDGSAKAAPTGAPWIDTNTGFLRFVRSASDASIWMANVPPENEVIPVSRYLQAIGDAAMVGAQWVVALDKYFAGRLIAGEEKALAGWKRIARDLHFWEKHRDWTRLKPCGQLAIVEDAASGALFSNGVLDMISARHTPLRTLPPSRLNEDSIRGARMAVNIDPPALNERQNAILRQLARDGGTLLTAPPGWTFPEMRPDQITVDEEDVGKLDDMWRGVNSIVGRENLGVRLFNVASMRSELVAGPGDAPTVLHLLNYSDYPVENITVQLGAKYHRARIYAPGAEPVDTEIYENGEVDIPAVESAVMLVLE